MAFTLDDIRNTVRNVVADSALTDVFIDDLVNKYYLYVLPDDMKPYQLLVPYTFYTLKNQVYYTFDNETYLSFEPEVFCNQNRLFYYQDQSIWIRDYQFQYNTQNFAVGDGVTTNYATIPNQIPIVPMTVLVNDGVENLVDTNGDGILIGSLGGAGTVDYITGQINVTFFTAPPLGNSIYVTWAPQITGFPRALFYDKGSETIQLSPIPDNSYRIQAQAYIYPTAFMQGGSGAQVPLLQVWGYTIAYGVSLEIFRQRGQLDQLNLYKPEYEMYLDRASGNSCQQLANQRSLAKW